MIRHRRPAPSEQQQLDAIRISILEQQVTGLSRANVRAGVEHAVQAAIIRRNNARIAILGETLRRLLLSYAALARVRTARPARVLDSGTPGVEVTR